MDSRKELDAEIKALEQKQWDLIKKDETLRDKLGLTAKLYKLGMVEECKAIQSYMDLIAQSCPCDLDDEDRQAIMEIIADELNHVRKLQTIIKKYQTIKAASK